MIYIRTIFSILISLSLLLSTASAAIGDPVAIPNANNFINAGLSGREINTTDVVEAVDGSIGTGLISILQFLYQAGLLIAVCVFAFMGVQFVIASPQQKAQLKASLLPYFVGLLLFVAGVPIAIFIINIFLQLL